MAITIRNFTIRAGLAARIAGRTPVACAGMAEEKRWPATQAARWLKYTPYRAAHRSYRKIAQDRRIVSDHAPAGVKIQEDQFEGYLQVSENPAKPYDPGPVPIGDLTYPGSNLATKRMRSIPDPPCVIIFIDDETAFGVLHAAH